MCRLMFIPGYCNKISARLLKSQLDFLEFSCGGDGNGWYAVCPKKSHVIHVRKVKLSNRKTVETILPLIRKGYSIYWHTRKISVGWAADNQCHPHPVNGQEFVGSVTHNGTWFDGSTLAKYFQCGSDTAAFAKILGEMGLDGVENADLMPHSGVFMICGHHPSAPAKSRYDHIVIYKSGDLKYCPHSGIWASEFCPSWVGRDNTYSVAPSTYALFDIPPVRQLPPVTMAKSSKTSKSSKVSSNSKPASLGFESVSVGGKWDWSSIESGNGYVSRGITWGD